jgi:undecaprenyl-diphosphatase
MDLILAIKAIIMGLVEGFTEFLPISSTGHLILAGSLLNFTGEKAKVFEIAIQAGAILAVMWEYRVRIGACLRACFQRPRQQKLRRQPDRRLPAGRHPRPPVQQGDQGAPVRPGAGGAGLHRRRLVILWVGTPPQGQSGAHRIETVDDMTMLDAFKVGCAQCVRADPRHQPLGRHHHRRHAVRPVAQGGHRVLLLPRDPDPAGGDRVLGLKARDCCRCGDLPLFGIGGLAAFVSAFLCVRWLLRYISTHDFTIFAWYRIVFGILVWPPPTSAGSSGRTNDSNKDHRS